MTLSRRFLKHVLFIASTFSLLVNVNARADELVVSAAASLTNAFKAVSDVFEQQHPGTKVLLNFGASDVLMQQIAKGAPAGQPLRADRHQRSGGGERETCRVWRSGFGADRPLCARRAAGRGRVGRR